MADEKSNLEVARDLTLFSLSDAVKYGSEQFQANHDVESGKVAVEAALAIAELLPEDM